jgi:hypothetical protein
MVSVVCKKTPLALDLEISIIINKDYKVFLIFFVVPKIDCTRFCARN